MDGSKKGGFGLEVRTWKTEKIAVYGPRAGNQSRRSAVSTGQIQNAREIKNLRSAVPTTEIKNSRSAVPAQEIRNYWSAVHT